MHIYRRYCYAFFYSSEFLGGFPGGAVVKSLPANAGDTRDAVSIPVSGRFPEVVYDNPLQYSGCEITRTEEWMGSQRVRHN